MHSCFPFPHVVRLAAQFEAPIFGTVRKGDVDVWYGAIVFASEKYYVLVHRWLYLRLARGCGGLM